MKEIICVVGTANGPVGLVVFFEQDVKDRAVELGLTTVEKIRKTSLISGIALFVPEITVFPAVVYFCNGVTGFWNAIRITGANYDGKQ